MQEKLDEFSKNCDLTSTDLEKTKRENKKLKEDLLNQNAKFQDMFDILQQEDKDILCSLVKQKVDIDSHQEALKRVMELLCEEGNKNINLSNNFTNFSKNIDGKVDELNFNIEKVASMQVHTTKSFSDLFSINTFQSKTEESMDYLKSKVNDMNTRLEIGLGKIDKATCSAGSKVEQMENMESICR